MTSPLECEMVDRLAAALDDLSLLNELYDWVLDRSGHLHYGEDPGAIALADEILHAFFLYDDKVLSDEEFLTALRAAQPGSTVVSPIPSTPAVSPARAG